MISFIADIFIETRQHKSIDFLRLDRLHNIVHLRRLAERQSPPPPFAVLYMKTPPIVLLGSEMKKTLYIFVKHIYTIKWLRTLSHISFNQLKHFVVMR